MKKMYLRIKSATFVYYFENGIKHYEIFEGLPKGCKLINIVRDLQNEDQWILCFETNIQDDDNEIHPKIKVYDACR